MRKDFKLSSPNQIRAFDRALFDYLNVVFERPNPRSVFVEARNEGSETVKTIDCNCPQTAIELANHIASALAQRSAGRA
ncbi:hypothetical protein [Maricaulis sp.]|uniref:hypothetical protein n=1 Tax=unclassified Maricaulis TaxID=2632371 RepID=UPI001B049081|nr:hypothetical protein [Maricaulis sp.]MBO6798545.1 hypothetical protein [Maricaulis sp.]